MAVGDDAQSIYSFRGATVSNILDFTQVFPKTQVIKLEQNYRSTQSILHLSNQILHGAKEKYEKNLFSEHKQGPKPQMLRPLSDQSQAQIILEKIKELAQTINLHEIAVLFRAGYQSYPLEVALNKTGFSFQKYGGLKFTEAAHIKDVLSYLRLVMNPSDLPAWQRVMSLVPGIGPKTSERLYTCLFQEDKAFLVKTVQKNQDLYTLLGLLDQLRKSKDDAPFALLEQVMESYKPLFEQKYRDDFPKRIAGLEQLAQIASSYADLHMFLTDMTLDPPEQQGTTQVDQESLILSTVHSAKGLEWDAVIVLDLVEERFPSRHALFDSDLMEEERRLLYVACTRAREYLGLCVPESLYNRFANKTSPASPSPFIQEIDPTVYDELQETYSGQILARQSVEQPEVPGSPEPSARQEFGFCQHKIFGRGKVISFIPPNKYKVNFPGFGLKVIQGDYIQMEI
jgi:DNA helicase-2/ATP-dependent DNA helicase PcrA